MYYKPTDLHSYLLHSSLHPPHFKNSIPFIYVVMTPIFSTSQCASFAYPISLVQAGHHSAQLIDRQSSLQTSWKEHSDCIPFTLTFHPHNHSVKSIILKNFKLLQNDTEIGGTIFSQPPLIPFKRDKKRQFFGQKFIPNQPGTSKCARARCKTCPFIHNATNVVTWNDTHNVICVVCKSRPCSSRLVVLISSASLI